MGDSITFFKSIPWCAELIQDPLWEPVRTRSRTPKLTTEDAFFAETLSTERTVRHLLSLKPRELAGEGWGINEIKTILDLGNGVSGHPHIAHGGFVATMLDEILSMLITLNVVREHKEAREQGRDIGHTGLFTAYLNTTYKKPVPTPGVVLCNAKFERREGKKIIVTGTIEDGMGKVYATAEGLFVYAKPKL
ncbi:hypothetical protein GQ43DRAFT_378806 [Delitschia confertaspora ATCC 74209]|uniref:Thioesterase domain-containing protein n=1 Tax=Delitschia confertaspora ATCC 74209 TaxID=1513339 RepID=A0A9P4JHH2_9PLEO|nr:hypothetical protein GQ43DRAFT_378806 [Delitschia confertaspora ATCC 74209]